MIFHSLWMACLKSGRVGTSVKNLRTTEKSKILFLPLIIPSLEKCRSGFPYLMNLRVQAFTRVNLRLGELGLALFTTIDAKDGGGGGVNGLGKGLDEAKEEVEGVVESYIQNP